jgi:hypothetical protein
MKDDTRTRREIELLITGLNDLDASLCVPRPYSKAYLRSVVADLMTHASAALFQLDCLTDDVTAFHQTVPKK